VAERRPPHTPSSEPDGEGVRVLPKPRGQRRMPGWVGVVTALTVFVVVTMVGWFVLGPEPDSPDMAGRQKIAAADAGAPPAAAYGPPARTASTLASAPEPQAMPSNDPDDLAAYFQPGDPTPTGAEVIEALQQAGVRTGLGAFNPPGTSPPLAGLAVPADFKLPEGYVRHHQVTDEGVPIEPILMFSPDFTLYDAQGRPIAMPASRVVPPELAPPGLPLRRVRVGSP